MPLRPALHDSLSTSALRAMANWRLLLGSAPGTEVIVIRAGEHYLIQPHPADRATDMLSYRIGRVGSRPRIGHNLISHLLVPAEPYRVGGKRAGRPPTTLPIHEEPKGGLPASLYDA